jgi:hypothetical protein
MMSRQYDAMPPKFPINTTRLVSALMRHLHDEQIIQLNQRLAGPTPLLGRAALVSDLHSFHAWKQARDAAAIQFLQAELDARQHDVGGAGRTKDLAVPPTVGADRARFFDLDQGKDPDPA